MADGRRREEWQHTSSILALTANIHRGKGDAFKPSDFDPFAVADRSDAIKVSLKDLRPMLMP